MLLAAVRRLGLAVAVAGFPFSSLAAESGSVASTGHRDLDDVVADRVLRVAMTRFDLPPFHHRRADGSIGGPEAELARQIASALKVEVAFVDDAPSFDAVVDTIAGGRADIGLSKLSQTYYRLMRVRFSEPYITLRHALLYNRAALARLAQQRPPQEFLRDFSGSLGVIAGSAYVDFARRNFPGADIILLPNWSAAIEALDAGRVDSLYRDEFEIQEVLQKRPARNVQFGAAIILDQNAFLSVAICDTCAKLQQFINFHLAETRGTFTLRGLLIAAEKTE